MLLTAQAAPAAAQTPDPPETASAAAIAAAEDGALHSQEEAERHDLALVAASRGWTLEQAADQRYAGDAVAALAKRIDSLRPGVVVGSALASEPGGAPSLYIAGGADRLVSDLVAGAPIPVNLVDHQPYSLAELQARTRAVHAALRDLGFRHVSTKPDITNRGRIRAELTRQPGLPDTPTEVASHLPADLSSNVEITIRQTPVVKPEAAYGGMRMLGSLPCTSGWSVVNDAGTTGVTTAGHCSVSSIREPNVGTWSLTHQQQHIGTFGDVEWKTTPTTEPARFFASSSTVRDVTAVAAVLDISIGESVCLYGRSSDQRNCSPEVTAIGVSCGGGSSMVETAPDVGDSGDSGGGWSFGTTAYGLHFGNCGSGEGFSLAIALDAAFGVQVRTT